VSTDAVVQQPRETSTTTTRVFDPSTRHRHHRGMRLSMKDPIPSSISFLSNGSS
jgi:hypothetical protein